MENNKKIYIKEKILPLYTPSPQAQTKSTRQHVYSVVRTQWDFCKKKLALLSTIVQRK